MLFLLVWRPILFIVIKYRLIFHTMMHFQSRMWLLFELVHQLIICIWLNKVLHYICSLSKKNENKYVNGKAREKVVYSGGRSSMSCLLAISQDLAISIGQIDSCFWNRTLEHFSASTVGIESRTLCSIQNRWDKIWKDCSKYYGCLSQIEHRHLTRATQSDKVRFFY